MKLTGKAKDSFEEWYNDQHSLEKYEDGILIDSFDEIGLPIYIDLADIFYDLTESMQWGVYQDWARSVKYSAQVIPYNFDTTEFLSDDSFSFFIHKKIGELFSIESDGFDFESEPEARSAAIEKLDEIYNEKS